MIQTDMETFVYKMRGVVFYNRTVSKTNHWRERV